uniref:Protein BCCIP homolog n=1 Tax=Glossina austeni TaxID=7395 RepID=A0A1A9UNX3_GLOAU
MSSKKNKNLHKMEEEVSDDDTESSGASEDDELAYAGNEQVQIDFEGRVPTDPDSHGICQLLQRVFLKAHINCMLMAELIIGKRLQIVRWKFLKKEILYTLAQNFVGSVICQCESDGIESDMDDDMCDDGTIFGITTVLNITAKKGTPCVDQLRAFIIKKAEKHATDAVLKHFRDIFGDETRSIGYLINERFINIPTEISVPLLENLEKEIVKAQQKGMKFNFLYRKESKKGKSHQDFYTNAEEELLVEKAINSFEYSVVDESDMGMGGDWLKADGNLIPYRKVILFDAKQLPDLIIDIRKQAKTHLASIHLLHRTDRVAFATCFTEIVETSPEYESCVMPLFLLRLYSQMSSKESENLNEIEEDFIEDVMDSEDDLPHSVLCSSHEIDVEDRKPSDPDWRGISRLLQKAFLQAHIDLEAMSEIIIEQNFIGSVIRQNKSDTDNTDSELDDENAGGENRLQYYHTIFGITTVLNITDKEDIANNRCLQELRSFLIEKAEKSTNNASFKNFRDALDNEARPIGYLINERFLNVPAEISIPLLENLQQEITAAQSENVKYDFAYFLMIIKMYRKEAKGNEPKLDFYFNAEEELLVQKAVDSFEYSVADVADPDYSGDSLKGLIPYRKIILYDAKNLPDSIVDIRKHIAGDAF